VSSDLRLVCPSPLLVLIPLLVLGGRQRSGVATRSGAGHNGHDVTSEYAVRRWRKSCLGLSLSPRVGSSCFSLSVAVVISPSLFLHLWSYCIWIDVMPFHLPACSASMK
jgi:hypothetical protein